MVPEGLQAYIDTCRAQGASDEAIRQALMAAGWMPDDINAALPPPPHLNVIEPPMPPQESTAAASSGKRLAKGGLLGVGVLLVLCAILIAFAEQGYLPAVSRLYRRTSLPLLWGSTTGKPSIGLGKMLLSTSQQKASTVDMSFEISVDKADPSKAVTLGALLPSQGKRLADVAPAASDALDVPAEPPFNPEEVLPLKLDIGLKTSTDAARNLTSSYSLDLSSLEKAFHPTETPTAPSKLTFDLVGTISAKTFYFRSNLLPVLDAANKGKWLAVPLPDSTVADWEDPQKAVDSISDQDKQEFAAIVDAAAQDEGISREGGHAYAHYKLRIDKEVLQRLAATPSLSKYKSDFTTSADSVKGAITMDVAIDPHTGLLHEISGTLDTPNGLPNLNSNLSFKLTTAFAGVATVGAPPANEVIAQDATSYVENLYTETVKRRTEGAAIDDSQWFGNSKIGLALMEMAQASLTGLQGSEARALNAEREGAVTELGNALELYKIGNNGKVPSTEGSAQDVDDPNGALLADHSFSASYGELTKFSDGQKYHYTYQSDGLHYELSTTIDDETTGKPKERFVIKDGVSQTLSLVE